MGCRDASPVQGVDGLPRCLARAGCGWVAAMPRPCRVWMGCRDALPLGDWGIRRDRQSEEFQIAFEFPIRNVGVVGLPFLAFEVAVGAVH
jgi:hypothetical protein